MIDYYTPRDIFFTREQMIWLITWLPMLSDGCWPPNPQETGYIELTQSSHSHRAPFETPCQFAGEVNSRLRSTKEAGECLVFEVQNGMDIFEMLSPPARRALNYISGWKRRLQTYAEWKRDDKKYHKNVVSQ